MSTTERPLEPAPVNRFQGRELVSELIRDMSGVDSRDPKLSYDRQLGVWTLPDFFTEDYTLHTEKFKSPEVCTILDIFAAAPELGTLEELGGWDLLYLPKLNQDDPYYNPLFMTAQQRNAYRESGSLDIIRQAYMAHDNSEDGSLQRKVERTRKQLAIAAVAGGFVAKSTVDTVLDWFGYHKKGGELVKHVNANMDHVKVVARHVEHMEDITKKMFASLGVDDERECLIELYLHLTVAIELLFDRVKQIASGLDQLGLHSRVTPHLVKLHDMQEQVYGLQTELH